VLSIYDVFAVFFSKHMIALAKGAVEHNLPLLLFGGEGRRRFILGTGDVVLPCAFALAGFYISPFLQNVCKVYNILL
jgi:presenilin-like A22 family membrane protease